jgi:hypothetical protein
MVLSGGDPSEAEVCRKRALTRARKRECGCLEELGRGLINAQP